MRPKPLSPYALQKLIGEQYCQLFTKLYGLETVTTRYFNVFGPRQEPGSPYSGVISLFIDALTSGKTRPTIHGDGRQTRDFTYVGDVVNGVLRCCDAPNVAGEVINVAAGGRVSLLELIRALQVITGKSDASRLRSDARRRREGFAGGHLQGPPDARLRAERAVRRGTAPHRGVVPDRQLQASFRRVADRGRSRPPARATSPIVYPLSRLR